MGINLAHELPEDQERRQAADASAVNSQKAKALARHGSKETVILLFAWITVLAMAFWRKEKTGGR
jgi:hypothetical protein